MNRAQKFTMSKKLRTSDADSGCLDSVAASTFIYYNNR